MTPVVIAMVGCGDSQEDPGRVELTTGHELQAWHEAPTPSTVLVSRIDALGARRRYLQAAAPLAGFHLEASGVARFEVSAISESGGAALVGRSLHLDQAGLAGVTAPLFVARPGRFSRPPGDLHAPPGSDPLVALLGERSVLVIGNESTAGRSIVERYDFGAWKPAPRRIPITCSSPPCGYRSLVTVGSSLALVLGAAQALWFDLQQETWGEAPVPEGLASYSDLLGGAAVRLPHGATALVGAGRTDQPSNAVLRLSATGELRASTLLQPRQGAAAAWLEGRGLLVLGGSTGGDGPELLAPGAHEFVRLPFGPDGTVGAAIAGTADGRALRVGGRAEGGEFAETVRLDPSCAVDCQPEPFARPVPVEGGGIYPLPDGSWLRVGTAQDGQTAAFVLQADGAVSPAPLRLPRSRAVSLAIPQLEQVAVVGGLDGADRPLATLELFVPEACSQAHL